MTPEIQFRRSQREAALLGAPAPLTDGAHIFGPPILPINPWHHLLLIGYANALFCGAIPTVRDVLQYLWFCSPEFWALTHNPDGTLRTVYNSHYRVFRFWLFRQRWKRSVRVRVPGGYGPSQRAITAIRTHATQMFLDRPGLAQPRKKGEPPPTPPPIDVDGPHELAVFHRLCRRVLGYTRQEFWSTPYADTNQLLAVTLKSSPRNPHVPEFTPRDRELGDYLRAKKAARASAPMAHHSSLVTRHS